MKMWFIDAIEYCLVFKKNYVMKIPGIWMELETIIMSEVT